VFGLSVREFRIVAGIVLIAIYVAAYVYTRSKRK
jgi:hypothetical protein